jgi:hypothetical protein
MFLKQSFYSALILSVFFHTVHIESKNEMDQTYYFRLISSK